MVASMENDINSYVKIVKRPFSPSHIMLINAQNINNREYMLSLCQRGCQFVSLALVCLFYTAWWDYCTVFSQCSAQRFLRQNGSLLFSIRAAKRGSNSTKLTSASIKPAGSCQCFCFAFIAEISPGYISLLKGSRQ